MKTEIHPSSIKIICIIGLGLLYSGCNTSKQNLPEIQIRKEGSSYNLIRNGAPYFIKGVVGNSFEDKLKKYGANSVRIWREFQEGLDQANEEGLSVLVSLPIRAERDGMDYDNPQMVKEQFDTIMEMVRSIKDHPALLMYAIGNELDYIPGTLPYKLSVWDAVNQIASAIHQIDPGHPVMTVVGDSMFEKIRDLKKRAPALDLLGLNMYGAMFEVPRLLEEYGWEKPYVFTEWGVSGYWEVPRTSWGAPYEENTSVKANIYREKYLDVIKTHPDQCLGSYVFLWGWKQEHTHTWFGMLDPEGNESEAVGVMYEMWTGNKPDNQAPHIDSLTIDDAHYLDDVILVPGSLHEAEVIANDPDGDAIIFVWEIRPEADYADYAGQGEKTPEVIKGLVDELGGNKVTFMAPGEDGAYRIYIFLYDGENHYATANKPFYVGNPI